MKLENQVCSLELSKQLEKLGVEQGSLSYWVHINGEERNEWVILFKKEFSNRYRHYSAFTVAELGEIIIKLLKN